MFYSQLQEDFFSYFPPGSALVVKKIEVVAEIREVFDDDVGLSKMDHDKCPTVNVETVRVDFPEEAL